MVTAFLCFHISLCFRQLDSYVRNEYARFQGNWGASGVYIRVRVPASFTPPCAMLTPREGVMLLEPDPEDLMRGPHWHDGAGGGRARVRVGP
jgi:hypothetical protein